MTQFLGHLKISFMSTVVVEIPMCTINMNTSNLYQVDFMKDFESKNIDILRILTQIGKVFADRSYQQTYLQNFLFFLNLSVFRLAYHSLFKIICKIKEGHFFLMPLCCNYVFTIGTQLLDIYFFCDSIKLFIIRQCYNLYYFICQSLSSLHFFQDRVSCHPSWHYTHIIFEGDQFLTIQLPFHGAGTKDACLHMWFMRCWDQTQGWCMLDKHSTNCDI